MNQLKENQDSMPGWVKWLFVGSVFATAMVGVLTFTLFHYYMA